ncbi:MAG: hypothetical protein WC179_07940 [Candidatus Cloacimonadaceae bacterium]
MSYTKNRKIKAIRLSDGKQRLFETLEQASKICHVSTRYIKRSMSDPFHESNHIDKWSPYTVRGQIKRTPKPEFRFEEILDHQLTLIPVFEGEESMPMPSVYAAAEFLQISAPTIYARLNPNAPNNIVTDAEGRQWMVVAHREVDHDFGKRLREGEVK